MNFLNKISTKIFIFTAACCVFFTALLFFINQTNLNTATHKITSQETQRKINDIEFRIEENIQKLERHTWNIEEDDLLLQNLDKTNIAVQIFLNKEKIHVNQAYAKEKVQSLLKDKSDANTERFLESIKDITKGYLSVARKNIEIIDLSRALKKPLIAILNQKTASDRISFSVFIKSDFFGSLSNQVYDYLFVSQNTVGEIFSSSSILSTNPALIEQIKLNSLNNNYDFNIENQSYYFKKIAFLDSTFIVLKAKEPLQIGLLSKKVFGISLLGLLLIFFMMHFVLSNISKEISNRSKRLIDITQGIQSPQNVTSTTTELVYLDVAINRVVEYFKKRLSNTAEKTTVKTMVDLSNKANQYINSPTQTFKDFIDTRSFFRPSHNFHGDFYGTIQNDHDIYFFGGSINRHGFNAVIDTIATKTAISSLIKVSGHLALEEIVEKLNKIIFSTENTDYADTICKFLLVKVNPQRDSMEYINCGFPSPILVSENKITYLKDLSLPLGIRENQSYTPSSAQLFPGDRILSFSHGLLQIKSNEGDRWNMKNLLHTLQKTINSDDQIDEVILKSAAQHSQGSLIEKDISLFYIKIDKEWKTSLHSEDKKDSVEVSG